MKIVNIIVLAFEKEIAVAEKIIGMTINIENIIMNPKHPLKKTITAQLIEDLKILKKNHQVGCAENRETACNEFFDRYVFNDHDEGEE